MFAMNSHTRVSTDDRLVVKVFHESISIRKTKTEVASIPDDTIVLHRVLTSVGRREGEVGERGGGRWEGEVGEGGRERWGKVGGRGGGRWEGEVGEGGGRRGRKGRGGQEEGQEEEAAEREWGGDRRERERRIRWESN